MKNRRHGALQPVDYGALEKPKYFPDFFQLTLKRCVFVVPLNLEKV